MSDVFRKKSDLSIAILIGAIFFGLIAIGAYDVILYHDGILEKTAFWSRMSEVIICFAVLCLIFGLEAATRFRIPTALELILPVFSFLALGLGGGLRFYDSIKYWDKCLHTFAGAIFMLIGLAITVPLFRDMRGNKRIFAIVFTAFLFALGEGYVWEILEYTLDSCTTAFNSQSWAEGIIAVNPDGTYVIDSMRGTALIDTMTDMIVNLAGAAATVAVVTPLFVIHPKACDVFAARRIPKSISIGEAAVRSERLA